MNDDILAALQQFSFKLVPTPTAATETTWVVSVEAGVASVQAFVDSEELKTHLIAAANNSEVQQLFVFAGGRRLLVTKGQQKYLVDGEQRTALFAEMGPDDVNLDGFLRDNAVNPLDRAP